MLLNTDNMLGAVLIKRVNKIGLLVLKKKEIESNDRDRSKSLWEPKAGNNLMPGGARCISIQV